MTNKIVDKILKPKFLPTENSRNVEKKVIPTKRQEVLNKLRQVF